MNTRNLLLSSTVLGLLVGCGTKAPAPFGPVPTDAQLEWQKMETNMFVHFGPNTFTDAEWGSGKESEDIFNPEDLDCAQWAAVAKAAGLKGIIITAKHHDGFCLWPNPVSSHTVAQSIWKDGKGDVLKELSEACADAGLKFGIYISPWDRFDPRYGTAEYNDVFVATLNSALGNYGEVYEQWFDGACGEGPSGKRQSYDWNLYHDTVWANQPQAVIFSDVGPGCRWVGNERGEAGRTCWSRLDTVGYAPGSKAPALDTLTCGNVYGEAWIPSETDVSIRPGWFYRDSENDRVKSVNDLLTLYYNSVGRNSLLLLNIPADKRGHICAIDSVNVIGMRAALDKIFAEDLASGATASATTSRGRHFEAANVLDEDYDRYWAAPDGETGAAIEIALDGFKTFNRVMLQEYIPLGQRIAAFHIEALTEGGQWEEIARETTVGYKRIVLTRTVTATALRIVIDHALACPTLNRVAVYMDDIYVNPALRQQKKGIHFDEGHLIQTDLGKTVSVKGFTYEPVPGKCLLGYDFSVSTDGVNWKAVKSDAIFENIENNPIRQSIVLPEKVSARYVRLTPRFTQKGEGYDAVELAVSTDSGDISLL